jgi:hypothetical protein
MIDDTRLERRFRAADSAIFRELDGEAIILHLDTGIYFGLDVIGVRIWQGLARRESVDTIVAAIIGEFDVDEPRARGDVERLIDQLVAKGLVVPGDATTGR